MPYITVRQPKKAYQLTYEDIIRTEHVSATRASSGKVSSGGTITRFVEHIDENIIARTNVSGMIFALEEFCERYKNLYNVDRKSLYYEFLIPKKSGGNRIIDAPNDELKKALYDLKDIFENTIGALHHTSAFAYVEGRSTIDAIKRHQSNGSKWFLKTDCTNFFGSTTKSFIMHMLSMIFPFCEIVKKENGKIALERAVDLCILGEGLPQGTPISPMLTNIVMVPIDHAISRHMNEEGCVYTRYADDMIISSKKSFMYTEKVAFIRNTFKWFSAPYDLKREKTRYGSSSGSNWNLGVMLNKDNEITIGHKKRDMFRCMCVNYIDSVKKNQPWDFHEIQVFSGQISYYMMVEPEYITKIVKKYEQKFGINVIDHMKRVLTGR